MGNRRTTPIIDDDAPIERTRPAGTVPASSVAAGLGDAAPPRGRGRPPGVHATAASNLDKPARQPTRAQPGRTLTRETSRPGAAVVHGRSGEVLTRRRTTTEDKFYVPPNEIPRGWSYQWNPVQILGAEERSSQVLMHQNGWRPVPAERHEGRWFAPGTTGAIVVDGLRLEERPIALTEEAKAEDRTRAKAQVRDQTDSLRLTQKQLPGSQVARNRNAAGGMRMEIDPGLDIPVPQHSAADDSVD